MTDQNGTSVLRRMAAQPESPVADVPLTASRAVRLATTRGTENAIGLALTVAGVSEESCSLDGLLEQLSDEQLLMGLLREDMLIGLLVMTHEFSAAVVEVRTRGKLAPRPAPERRITTTDIVLARPLYDGLLKELSATTAGTVLDGWTTSVKAGERVASVRAVGLSLPDATYRLMKVAVDLGVADRKAELMVALPTASATIQTPTHPPIENWSESLEATVMEAPLTLDAVLNRGVLPLSVVTSLKVGQVLPLHGCTVSSVRLEAADGTFVTTGRLGQMNGNIAVRVEHPETSPMAALPGLDQAALGMGGMDMPVDMGGDDLMNMAPGAEMDLPDVAQVDQMMDSDGGADLTMGNAEIADVPLDAAPMDLGDIGVAPMDGDMSLPDDLGEMPQADLSAFMTDEDEPGGA